jgi:phenylacetate-coenzyme A ligase PaaK-like adenylate-forming protein
MRKRIDREAIYLRLPVFLQNILVSLEGHRIKRRRYGKGFDECFERVKTVSVLDPEALHDFRTRRLRDFLEHAKRSPFWSKSFKEHSLDLDSTDLFSELNKLPILTKDIVKKYQRDILCPGIPDNDIISCHTSGTTGSGLVFSSTGSAEREQWAVWWRYRDWHGISSDTWCGYFGGRSLVPLKNQHPPFWRINRAGKQVMFSAYHLKRETAKAYLDALRDYSIEWLHGYPSSLSLLATYMLEQNLPRISSIKVITTGAESLLPHQRATIKRAFSTPVFQHYGQAEGVANISECEEGRLHVDEDFSFVEFIPIAGDGRQFKIVGTNWTNSAFPLVRYDTGDIATLGSTACDCGRPGRIIEEIDGRKEDFLVLPDGAMIGRLDHIFKDLVHIREAQIYQKDPGGVVFRVVKGARYDKEKEEDKLLTEARKRLGEEITIDIEYMNAIPRTVSGKLRFVVSDVESGQRP